VLHLYYIAFDLKNFIFYSYCTFLEYIFIIIVYYSSRSNIFLRILIKPEGTRVPFPRCTNFSCWFKYFSYNTPQLRDANLAIFSLSLSLSLSQQQSSSIIVITSVEFTSWLSSLCTAGKPRWRVYSSMRFSGGMHLRLWAWTHYALHWYWCYIYILILTYLLFLLFCAQHLLIWNYNTFFIIMRNIHFYLITINPKLHNKFLDNNNIIW